MSCEKKLAKLRICILCSNVSQAWHRRTPRHGAKRLLGTAPEELKARRRKDLKARHKDLEYARTSRNAARISRHAAQISRHAARTLRYVARN